MSAVPQAQHADAPTLRVCVLYPEQMNIYADRGNLIVLRRRCAWRGLKIELTQCGIGDELDGQAHDLYYMGGGQDRDQRLCAADLLAHKAAALHQAHQRGAVILSVCGGYQLLGHSYEISAGECLRGVGIFACHTVRSPGARLIGNIAIEVPAGALGVPGRATAAGGKIAGFENHGGRTSLDAGQAPFGRVLKGFGNDGSSGYEGAVTGNAIGTYIHGPLLPRNPWLADHLIARALGIDRAELPALDDELELLAQRRALALAGAR